MPAWPFSGSDGGNNDGENNNSGAQGFVDLFSKGFSTGQKQSGSHQPVPQSALPQNVVLPPPDQDAATQQAEQINRWVPNDFSMNCPVSTLLSTVMGGLAGGAFGSALGVYSGLTDPDVSGGWRVRLRHTAVVARGRAWGLVQAFAAFSLLYEASLCSIEKYRAKTDVTNHVYAGCFTGGALGGHTGGFGAACVGCVGIAGFSFLIEKYLHREE